MVAAYDATHPVIELCGQSGCGPVARALFESPTFPLRASTFGWRPQGLIQAAPCSRALACPPSSSPAR